MESMASQNWKENVFSENIVTPYAREFVIGCRNGAKKGNL
jgi:hypothetical protein